MKSFYHMFIILCSEISLFHKCTRMYFDRQSSLFMTSLVSLVFPAVKSVIKLNKILFLLVRFSEFNM